MEAIISPTSNCVKNSLSEFTSNRERLDSRLIHKRRNFNLKEIIPNSLYEISSENLKIHCKITADVVKPKPNFSDEGNIKIHIDLPCSITSSFSNEQLNSMTTEILQPLEKFLRESGSIDFKNMCIKTEELVWHLNMYLTIFEFDGCPVDYSCICIVYALCKSEFSQTIDDTVYNYKSQLVCLSFLHTIALYNDGRICFVDPSLLEEICADGKIIVGCNQSKEMFCFNYTGDSCSLSVVTKTAMLLAQEQTQELIACLKKVL
ncbi:hypothetical protein HZS_5302 [Henneguya salminicola]|nr:hypothetical protein HZS_5302 [Henneguya salminicola]